MKKVLISFIVIGMVFGCKSKEDKTLKNDLPSCVKKEIESIEKKTVDNPPVAIDEYQYNGKRVFLYTADCCDQFDVLYDENCNSICSPSGGFEGGGDHKCEDFSKTAKHIKTIWKKEDK